MLKSIGFVLGSYLLSIVLVLSTDPLLSRVFPGDFVRRGCALASRQVILAAKLAGELLDRPVTRAPAVQLIVRRQLGVIQ